MTTPTLACSRKLAPRFVHDPISPLKSSQKVGQVTPQKDRRKGKTQQYHCFAKKLPVGLNSF
jgi:hypothetical protein